MLELANPARWRKVRRGVPPIGPCVYLAQRVEQFGASTQVWKIGSATDLRQRLHELTRDQWEAVAYLPCATAAEALELEAEAHRRAGPLRTGEFYTRRPRL